MNFKSFANIQRLSHEDGGSITGYSVDFRVECADCGLPFRFMGLPFGLSFSTPRLSADSCELRAPIEPAYVPEIMGTPMISGSA
jgi:hypothetical protein